MGALLQRLIMVLAIVTAAGFIAFADRVSSLAARQTAPPAADAIVTLTGGGGARIAAGVELLREGRGSRLLISGVHADTTVADLRRLAGAGPEDDALFDCCVDIDRVARTTRENGAETAAWARARGYRSLIVVTSDYHMPRALLVMKRSMREAAFAPHAVARAGADTPPWWRNPRDLRRLSVEYGKFLVILAQEAVRGGRAGDAAEFASAP